MHNLHLEVFPKMWATFLISKKLLEVNENSPNVVALFSWRTMGREIWSIERRGKNLRPVTKKIS
jgi:hypothetical protein